MQNVPALDEFKPAIQVCLAVGSDFHVKAVEVRVVDTLKKRSETFKKLTLKHTLKRWWVDEDADESAQPEAPVVV